MLKVDKFGCLAVRCVTDLGLRRANGSNWPSDREPVSADQPGQIPHTSATSHAKLIGAAVAHNGRSLTDHPARVDDYGVRARG